MNVTTINSGFIGIFKVGDNINTNLSMLRELYKLDTERNPIFNKIKIVTITSIIEAVLFDFFYRAKNFTIEGIKNIPGEVLNYFKLKKITKFESYIRSAEKHGLFDPCGVEIYNNLHDLRKLRNRVHIQNEKMYFEHNELTAFSHNRRSLAEKTLMCCSVLYETEVTIFIIRSDTDGLLGLILSIKFCNKF